MCTANAAVDRLKVAGQRLGQGCLSLSPAMHTPWSSTRCWYDTWLIKLAASRNDWGGEKGDKMQGFPHSRVQSKDPKLVSHKPASFGPGICH